MKKFDAGLRARDGSTGLIHIVQRLTGCDRNRCKLLIHQHLPKEAIVAVGILVRQAPRG